MKRCILLLAFIFGFQLTMLAQKSKSNQAPPKENIHVNREYDEKGNLIKFDSVYSYTWSGDTTLIDSIHPKDFHNPFGDNFRFSPDSSFFDHSFFDNFDQLFFDPFSKKQDSMLNHLGFNNQFRDFHFKNDTITSKIDIDDFFNQFNGNKNDSISSKSPNKNPFVFPHKSMNDLMEMMQKQMQEMEEQQRKLFKK